MINDVKQQLNILIEYYRNQYYEQTKNKEFSKELFSTIIIDHKKISICSPTTYRKLASGNIIKNNDIYIQLLKKLGLNYCEQSFVYTQKFENLCKQLIVTQEQFLKEEQLHLITNALLNMNTDDIIEKEYRTALIALYDMIKKGHMLHDSIILNHIINVFSIFNQSLKQCLEVAVYNFCVQKRYDTQIPHYFAMIEDTYYHRVHKLYYYIDAGIELNKVEEEMQTLINYYLKTHNYNQVLQILIMKMKYYDQIGIDSKEAESEIETFLSKYDSQIVDNIKNSYLYFKAKKYNRGKQYRIAKQLFERLLNKDITYINYVLSYYFICLIMLDENIEYDKMFLKELDEKDAIIYRYFQIPKDNYEDREDYIIYTICDANVLNESYLVKSFLHELRKIVRITKHYVKLEKYLEKTDDYL